MNRMAVLWIALAVVAGALLFKTSQQVTDGRQHLANITADIRREEDSLRVLQAEWSYLNQPDRLEKLSAQYLKLTPMKGKQFADTASLPLRPVAAEPAPTETPALVAAITTETNILNTTEEPAAAAEAPAAIAPAAGMPAAAIAPVPMRKPATLKAPVTAAAPAPAAPKPAAAKPAMPPQPATPKPAAAAATTASAENNRSFGDVLNSLGGGL